MLEICLRHALINPLFELFNDQLVCFGTCSWFPDFALFLFLLLRFFLFRCVTILSFNDLFDGGRGLTTTVSSRFDCLLHQHLLLDFLFSLFLELLQLLLLLLLSLLYIIEHLEGLFHLLVPLLPTL